MARSLAPDIEISARVTESEEAAAACRAGADCVPSVQQVRARLVAAESHGERVMNPVGQIRLLGADAAAFAGQSLDALRRNPDDGWSAVGLARDGQIHAERAATIESGDEEFVAGSDAAIQAFERTMR